MSSPGFQVQWRPGAWRLPEKRRRASLRSRAPIQVQRGTGSCSPDRGAITASPASLFRIYTTCGSGVRVSGAAGASGALARLARSIVEETEEIRVGLEQHAGVVG